MVQCQCLKTDGNRCSREATTDSKKDSRFCWQHQGCQRILTSPSNPPSTITTTSSKPTPSRLFPKNIPTDVVKYAIAPYLGSCEDITNKGKRCSRALRYKGEHNQNRDCATYCRENIKVWLKDLYRNHPIEAILKANGVEVKLHINNYIDHNFTIETTFANTTDDIDKVISIYSDRMERGFRDPLEINYIFIINPYDLHKLTETPKPETLDLQFDHPLLSSIKWTILDFSEYHPNGVSHTLYEIVFGGYLFDYDDFYDFDFDDIDEFFDELYIGLFDKDHVKNLIDRIWKTKKHTIR